ncbi:MAG TPA: hypothetical protein VIK89_08765 [Cytophagaceae bacterium]
MRKLFALLFVAAAMTFTSCGSGSEQTATDAETVDTTATQPEVIEVEPAPQQEEDTTEATEGADSTQAQ